ncbi:DUF481 domain-containing protein [Granulicella sp. S190]|uniref:DUF481 domain-containing protein n=1 Tax=Granulicella sp. S190 TaxID=1747226 RepID=UPI00131C4FFF|nr:DUF481 domain-containing protein [Granulicella sp. S190]
MTQPAASGWAQGAKPAPDVIVFTNGDQLTGTLERATGDSFVFKSDVVGEITVTADKIKELHTAGKFVALKNGEKVTRTSKTPGTITYQDNAISLADESSSSTVETVPVKDLAALIDSATYGKEVTGNPGIFQDWTGGVSGGVSLVESTQTGQTYSAAVNLIRLVPSVTFLPARTRDTVNVLETYGKLTQPVIPQTTPATPDSVAKTNIFHADAEHDKYLTPRLYGLVGVSYDHNFSQGLNLQQIYGAGIGYTVIQTPVQEFDVKADVHYERQNFVPPTASTDLIGSSFTELYHRTLPRKILFTESGTFIPSWNDPSIYSAIFEAGLQLPTYKRFSLNLNLQDNYLSNPAIGFKDNSFQFLTGITYTLK